jgi:hypothetical protein
MSKPSLILESKKYPKNYNGDSNKQTKKLHKRGDFVAAVLFCAGSAFATKRVGNGNVPKAVKRKIIINKYIAC